MQKIWDMIHFCRTHDEVKHALHCIQHSIIPSDVYASMISTLAFIDVDISRSERRAAQNNPTVNIAELSKLIDNTARELNNLLGG